MVTSDKPVKKVVLIDDSVVDNMIHTSLLQKSKFAKVIEAFDSSVAALEAMRKLSRPGTGKGEIPNYIFLDIAMPVMGSYDFLDEYEKLDRKLLGACKVVILTSSINPKDKVESLRRDSVAAYFVKPLTIEILSSLTN